MLASLPCSSCCACNPAIQYRSHPPHTKQVGPGSYTVPESQGQPKGGLSAAFAWEGRRSSLPSAHQPAAEQQQEDSEGTPSRLPVRSWASSNASSSFSSATQRFLLDKESVAKPGCVTRSRAVSQCWRTPAQIPTAQHASPHSCAPTSSAHLSRAVLVPTKAPPPSGSSATGAQQEPRRSPAATRPAQHSAAALSACPTRLRLQQQQQQALAMRSCCCQLPPAYPPVIKASGTSLGRMAAWSCRHHQHKQQATRLQEKWREKAASLPGAAPQPGPAQCLMAGSRSVVLQATWQQDAAAVHVARLPPHLHESPTGSCSSSFGPRRSQQCSSSSLAAPARGKEVPRVGPQAVKGASTQRPLWHMCLLCRPAVLNTLCWPLILHGACTGCRRFKPSAGGKLVLSRQIARAGTATAAFASKSCRPHQQVGVNVWQHMQQLLKQHRAARVTHSYSGTTLQHSHVPTSTHHSDRAQLPSSLPLALLSPALQHTPAHLHLTRCCTVLTFPPRAGTGP